MQKHKNSKEQGAVEVEATIILPIAILSVVFLLYLSLFLFQRANLQACLETCLITYKNVITDDYVKKNSEMIYEDSEDSHVGEGNSYSVDGILLPYRWIAGSGKEFKDKEAFEEYFYSVAENMLFNNDIKLEIEYSNFVLFQQLEATATQELQIPIDMSILGIDGKFRISVAGRVSVVDHNSMIRNVDYAVDLLEDTKLVQAAKKLVGGMVDFYNKIKEFLEIDITE